MIIINGDIKIMTSIKEFFKKKDMKKPLFLLGLSAVTVIAEVLRELNTFCVRRYEVFSDKLEDDIKIVFLSDLHGKAYGINNYKLVYAVKREKPDIILVGGDMLTRAEESTDVTAYELMKKLVEIAPVYLANGNHEQKMREYPEYYNGRYEEYKDAVEKLGVHVLENDSTVIECNGNMISINGLEVPVKCYGHFKDIPLEMDEVISRIGHPDNSIFQILMAHTPVYVNVYKEWGADLTLSGHLHGGIVRLPFIGGVITPQARLFPRYSGDMYKDGTHYIIVSRGLGTHTVNIRYLNRAELVSVVIKHGDEILC